jgi:hypothetical protein
MAKGASIALRLDDNEREALERAAQADDRTMSALVRKILVEWLRANGWIEEDTAYGKR